MVQIITEAVGARSQQVAYDLILKAGVGLQLRVQVVSDPYEAQCSARVSRWDGEWKEVYSIQPSNMQTPKGLYVQYDSRSRTGAPTSKFEKDRDELLRVAIHTLVGNSPEALLRSVLSALREGARKSA